MKIYKKRRVVVQISEDEDGRLSCIDWLSVYAYFPSKTRPFSSTETLCCVNILRDLSHSNSVIVNRGISGQQVLRLAGCFVL